MRDMKSSSGFSIIEMMISFLTVGLVMLAVFELVNSFQGNYNVGQENTSLRQNLQVAMNIMLREIREAGNDPNNERCCMDRGGDGIRPFPSGSVRRYVRTQAVRVRSLCSGLSGRPGSP